ncbi:MAG: HIT family hydrolase [Lentisphaerae bacterium GWF2_45_14]|nr:MAG: HIT family hydrolase [Lentisphaerae bacterium GWF2_45_14]
MLEEKRPLWAPWRIEFIRSKKDGSCFLCGQKKGKRDDESTLVVARGENIFVILNKFPYNSGHLMIAPYRHTGDISELSADERRELLDLTVAAKNVLAKLMRPDGFNAGFNLGLAGGAGVADHIHFHIVPRWNGDTNFMPVIGGPRVVPEALEDTAQLIRENWSFDI